MSPFDRMQQMYRENPQEMPFLWYVDWHHRNGFVFSTPSYFVMGRPVDSKGGTGINLSFQAFSDCQKRDCWYVHAMSGDLSMAWGCLPYHLPFFAFERLHHGQRRLAIVRTVRFKQLSLAYAHETFPPPAVD